MGRLCLWALRLVHERNLFLAIVELETPVCLMVLRCLTLVDASVVLFIIFNVYPLLALVLLLLLLLLVDY